MTRLREVGIGLHLEVEPPIFRFMAEWPPDHVKQAREEDFLGFHRNRSRLNLGQVENVADQVEQVGSGAVNGARKFNLFRREVACRGCH